MQAAYTNDVAFAARNVAFFLIPFAAMFVLLTEVRWTPRVLAATLGVIAAEAVVFSLVGIGQFVTAEIFWNPALERSNDFHLYFRVNSLFWDPNVYGRYLALALVLLATVLVWTRRPARMAGLALLAALVFAGLLFSFSQTSFIALLAGIAVLCALRYSLLWTAVATPFAIAAVAAAVLVVGGTSEAEDDPQEISSGHSGLIEGGVELARAKPLAGHGSASFPLAFREQEDLATGRPAISHNEPVTVAAEQGAVGLAAYVALLAAAAWTLLGGMRRLAPGLGAPRDAVGDPFEDPDSIRRVARIGLVAAFGDTRDPHDRLRGLPHRSPDLGAARRRRRPGGRRALGPRRTARPPGRRRVRPAARARMTGYLRRLATTGAAYTASSVLSKLIAVALLPLYTRHLTPDDYGAAEVLITGVIAASIVIRLGVIEALLRFYYKGGEEPDRSSGRASPRCSGARRSASRS